jgi:hypothetical protein
MKTRVMFAFLLASVVLCAAELDTRPAATILAVSRGTDKQSLLIQYELAGKTNEIKAIVTNGIGDFHFCRFLRQGMALALKDEAGEFYFATFLFDAGPGPIYPRLLPTFDARNHELLGIANTVGDTIVVSAVNRSVVPEFQALGWMYVNACPPTYASFSQVPTNRAWFGGYPHLKEFRILKK